MRFYYVFFGYLTLRINLQSGVTIRAVHTNLYCNLGRPCSHDTIVADVEEGADVREANGKSILENSCITISTESGDGRHSDVKRELSGVFHAISGANGRFKTGEILDVGKEAIDVYNTMLEAYQTGQRLGPKDREYSRVHGILA